jgi:RNA polymerase sigma-70 factor (ECF subfamily)
MVGSAIDGEDVVQDSIEHALRALNRGVGMEKPDAWLLRIAHNAAIDHLRRRSRAELESDDALADAEDPSSIAEQRVVAQAALGMFMQLPAAQRASVALIDVLGYELGEIARMLDMTVAAVKSHVHRGRARLREVAQAQAPERLRPLNDSERERYAQYARLFNARDFDTIRAQLTDDVRLDLIARHTVRGVSEVSGYFGNYARVSGWRVAVGAIEDRWVLGFTGANDEAENLVLIEWRGERISRIRDFRYARYVLRETRVQWTD